MTVPNTPEPCPTCKGLCCVNHNETFAPSLRYRHSGMKWHSCPDCDDGTYEICSEPEPFVPQRTAEDERAAVVAWLREHWSEVLEQTPQQTARLIERGDHRREEER